MKEGINHGSLRAHAVKNAPLMSTLDTILWEECLSALAAVYGVTFCVFSVIFAMTILKSCRYVEKIHIKLSESSY